MMGGAFLSLGVAYLYHRWGMRVIAILLPVGGAVMYALSQGQDISSLVAPFFVGLAAGYIYKTKSSFAVFILVTAAVLFLVGTASEWYLKTYRGFDVLGLIETQLKGAITQSSLTADDKKGQLAELASFMLFIRDFLPFIRFVGGVIFAAFCFGVIRTWFARRLNVVLTRGVELFRLYDYFIFVLIFSWAAVLFIDGSKYALLYSIILNGALMVSALYFIQAIGVIKYFILLKGFPGYTLYLVFSMMVMLGTGGMLFFSVVLTGFGSLDLWADFRKLNAHKENDTTNNNINKRED